MFTSSQMILAILISGFLGTVVSMVIMAFLAAARDDARPHAPRRSMFGSPDTQ